MNQKPFPDQICVGSDKLLVWNLSTASPDDISQGNQFVVRGYSIQVSTILSLIVNRTNNNYILENQSY